MGLLALVVLAAVPLQGQGVPCRPCVGIRVEDPATVLTELAGSPALPEEARLVVSWRAALDTTDLTAARQVRQAGASPWPRVVFRTPTPLLQNLQELGRELEQLSVLARGAGADTSFQILWEPRQGPGLDDEAGVSEYAFLLKRAAVAVTGAEAAATVVTAPLRPEADLLQSLYAEEVAAYVDAVALRPGPAEVLSEAVAVLDELDPGKDVVLDFSSSDDGALEVMAEAARWAAVGVSLTLFDLETAAVAERGAVVSALKVMAREFAGDLSLDPYSAPEGDGEGWSFVRGSDLGLRVVARPAPGSETVTLRFSDPQLQSPALVDPRTGEALPQYDVRRSRDGLEVELADPAAVVVLRLERVLARDLEGVEGLDEALTVEEIRQIPVEEVLRRLQAFEDAQSRRLHRYHAQNTTHLRFQLGTGVQTLEVTYEGDFFFRQGEGFDWAWQEFYVNGVRWRGKKVPKIPLFQPERAAALPLEIHFTREYRYRLRGTAVVAGRSCWVVDFEPAATVAGRSLFQGTVWVDRELFARVKTRAVQLGLEGEVISNEETIHYSPVDRVGAPAPWQPDSYWLPLRIVGQQLLSILNSTTVVEREILLTDVLINGDTFEDRYREVLASEVTMLRDTDVGLRYLVPDETGGRVVQQKLQPNRLFGAAGVFFDESFDFPIPLAGINYLSFDFKGTGNQVNVLFGGALLMADIADPHFLGTRFDAGADVFAVAFAGSDTVFRNNREVEAEEVEVFSPEIELSLGRPVGQFAKLDLEYGLELKDFRRADDTSQDFVLPEDHFEQSLTLTARYNRSGYRSRLWGSYHSRSQWPEWGLPGNGEFDPESKDYTRFGAALAKVWHLRYFQKVGAEVEYVDGSDLDRFSKYEFGFFSDTRVHGYESDRVRASRAWAAHLSYGFEVGELLRVDLIGDAAWASDEAAGLDEDFLGGVGLVGTFIGPWNTIVNLDLGGAVAGPDDGVVVFLTFLKLFR